MAVTPPATIEPTTAAHCGETGGPPTPAADRTGRAVGQGDPLGGTEQQHRGRYGDQREAHAGQPLCTLAPSGTIPERSGRRIDVVMADLLPTPSPSL
jgi:hypothetical protein